MLSNEKMKATIPVMILCMASTGSAFLPQHNGVSRKIAFGRDSLVGYRYRTSDSVVADFSQPTDNLDQISVPSIGDHDSELLSNMNSEPLGLSDISEDSSLLNMVLLPTETLDGIEIASESSASLQVPIVDGDTAERNAKEDAGPVLDASEEVMLAAEAYLAELSAGEAAASDGPLFPPSDAPDDVKIVGLELHDQVEAEQGAASVASEGDRMDEVEAILAASEEAVAAAEASMNVDLQDDILTKKISGAARTLPSTFPEVEIPAKVEPIESPRVGRILKFAVAAIGVWLCGPILSLIDTSSVGLLSGTTQQAALNPAVAVTEYAVLLIAFLYTGATNMIAAAREADKDVAGSPQSVKTFVGSLKLSTFVGAGLGGLLFVFARNLLRAIIGNDAINPAVFAAAMKYVRIRALGMPAAAMIGTAQAACLGMQDIKSPLYVLAAAAIVNLMGDMMFVGSSHPLLGGAAGAAWATVFSQYAAVGLFVHWLCNKPKPKKADDGDVVNLSNAIFELTGKPASAGEVRRRRFRDSLRSFKFPSAKAPKARLGSLFQKKDPTTVEEKKTEKSFSVRGFLEGEFKGRDLVVPPSKEMMGKFAPFVLPVTTTQIGRVSGYVAMSHVVSSSLGTVSMAAQQVIVSLFYCLTPVADSLSLTAQSFVPSVFEKPVSKERTLAMRDMIRNFAKASGLFGLVMVAAVSCIPLMSGAFTTDPTVAALVNTVVPLLAGFFALNGVMCANEGLLLGQKDLSFLGRVYGAFFFLVPYFMLRVKRAALAGVPGITIASVWSVFLGYQVVRTATWFGRVAWLQRRTNREAQQLTSS